MMCRKVNDMWENETVVLVTSLKKRLLGGEKTVRFGRISADEAVPTFIKTLFATRVENFLTGESPLSLKTTPHFDFQPDEIETFQNRILDVLREVACFHEKEVEEILREALVVRLDYLVKPVDTMRRILFEKSDKIDLSEMEKALDYFRKLLPYADQVLKECQQKGISSLQREEYGRIVTDMLHRLMGENPVKAVLQDFSKLTDFVSETKGEEINRVEGEVIQKFLVDRNLWGFRRALDVEMKLGKGDFDAVDLEMTLKRYLELKEEFSKGALKEEQGLIEEEVVEEKEKTVEVQVDEEKPIIEEEGWDFGEEVSTEKLVVEDEVVEKEKPSPEKPKSMRIIRREQKTEEEEGELQEPVVETDQIGVRAIREGLRNLVDEKMEKVFIKKLFSGDSDGYEQLLGKLDEAESWRAAKILIDNELFKRDVDPFSREAIKLVDLVYSRYYPEEGVGGKK